MQRNLREKKNNICNLYIHISNQDFTNNICNYFIKYILNFVF